MPAVFTATERRRYSRRAVWTAPLLVTRSRGRRAPPRTERTLQRLERPERPFVVVHEYLERLLMRDTGLEYDPAHEICSKVEFSLREGRGPIEQLDGKGRLTTADLPKLARPEFYQYVVGHYLKKGVSR